MKFFLYIILSTIAVPSAFGFDLSPFVMIGYGSYEKKGGAEISMGVQYRPYDILKIEIAPLTGLFKRKDDPRYERERDDDDKQLSCRDKTTGEVVDNKYCGITFKYAFESTVKLQLIDQFDIGVGTRVADKSLVYGVAVFRFTPSFGLEGKVGQDYNSLLLRVDFE